MRRIRTIPALAAAAIAMAAAGPLAGQSATDEPPAAQSAAERGVLRPGDVIRLRIWREPDLSGEFPVDENGAVVLPKIGSIAVTGESPAALERRILEEFRTYLRNPSIEITFLRRITIYGAVRAPGLHPVDPTMTVADALARAGGSLPYGAPNEVQLFRGGERITTHITQQTRINELPIRSGDHLFVPERSWLERHTGVLATVISSVVSLSIALITIANQ